METISPQTFCYTKVQVGPKMIRPQEVSALHVEEMGGEGRERSGGGEGRVGKR